MKSTKTTTHLHTPRVSRVSPIPDSVRTINGYPKKLIVFRIHASSFYWTRVYVNGRYHVKSTKTDNLNHAKEFAKEFFHDLLYTSESTSHGISMSRLITTFENSVIHNNPSKYERNNISRMKNHIKPYFSTKEVRSISNSDLIKFQMELINKDLGNASLRSNFTLLKTLFQFALNNGHINQIPIFPRIKIKPNDKKPRTNLDIDEYKHLCDTAEKLSNEGVSVRGIKITKEFKYLIQFMVNSFIRPSDLRVIKHKHIKIKQDGGDTWIELSHPATKTNDDVVQAMPVTVDIYRRLVEEIRGTTIAEINPNEYLFFPQYENRDTALASIEKIFRHIRLFAFPEDDRTITLYSLRHTAIMFRITIGQVDTFAIAKNARTSQEMIEKYYARHVKTQQLRKQLHALPKNNSSTKIIKKSDLL